jgi:hypothetical protein
MRVSTWPFVTPDLPLEEVIEFTADGNFDRLAGLIDHRPDDQMGAST